MPAGFVHLGKELEDIRIPANGILSRTLYKDGRVKVVLFGFDRGQELSEHTASMPAVLNFVKGRARVTLGKKQVDARAGTWVYMKPGLPHAIVAKTPVVMLLTLLK